MDFQALTSSLREELRSGKQELAEAYRAAARPDALRYLSAHAGLVDGVLQRLWQAMDLPPSLALAAVGGYGRGELYPGSDVDLLILLPREAEEATEEAGAPREKLERLVGLFWDIGLEVGHSVRTIEDCLVEAAGDITVQTALLENRPLAGNTRLFADFQARIRASLDAQAFFTAKRLEQTERYQRFQETPYNLEPNCKESPGGLRDLQNILWIAKGCGHGDDWHDLHQRHFLATATLRQVKKCEHTLQNLRIRLHLLTGRREDKLLFDHQESLAREMGIKSTASRRSSEVLMQAYYRNAKRVTQINTILLQGFAAEILPAPSHTPRPINARFRIMGDFLDIAREGTFERHPSALLESFQLLQQHPELRGMTARTLRALWRNRARIDARFRADPENRQRFLRLLQSSHGVVRIFRLMNQFSILERYLPAFGKIIGQMQYDLFHVYTVDQHTLQVMRNLRRFALDEFAHEYPELSRLHNAFARPWVLYVAALFHDIAKGRGGDHSLLGMEDARAFCVTHDIAAEDADLIVWLIGEHLSMSQTAQKEDISDPAVITAFAARVKTARRLTALYLLTVADIRGTSPKVWNNWKAELLENLYRQTLGYLESGETPEAQGVIQERQDEALRLLRYFALSDTVHERLWNQFDTVYFLRHSAEEIAWHTRALHYRIYNEKPVVKARVHPGGGLQVMVYTEDGPDLFLRTAGFFARNGYSIAEAKIHTTRHGYALDSFILLDVSGNADDRDMIAFIETELTQTLEHSLPIPPPAAGRLSRQVRHFPITPEVRIYPDERDSLQVLSLTAADRPGLLYRIAAVLAGHHISLHTARIATLGERVEDVFLISGPNLDKSQTRIRLEQDLLETLQIG
ncbi:MAG: [protein-PII] uridylyltransferase [Zoogloeaceae bacterium]|jgi:[protein-PII] uridylyltransferase|nr:[protein-PII] uridylyltransferase [Zoogloeaceae bacterium]